MTEQIKGVRVHLPTGERYFVREQILALDMGAPSPDVPYPHPPALAVRVADDEGRAKILRFIGVPLEIVAEERMIATPDTRTRAPFVGG